MSYVAMSFIPLLIVVAIVYFGARAVWVAVTLPKKVPREPACGGCGYAVDGLDSSTCPECGGDFRKVGISTPQFVLKWRGGYFSAILGWTLVMLMVGMVGMWVVAMLSFTRTMTPVTNTTTTTSTTLTPASNAYRSIRLEGTQGFGQSAVSTTIELVLTGTDGSVSTLAVDPAALTYTVDDGAGPGDAQSYDDDSLTGWFDDAGLDTADPDLAVEIKDLVRFVDIAMMNPLGGVPVIRSTSSFTSSRTATTSSGGTVTSPSANNELLIAMITMGVFFVVWIGGIVWIVMRRSRMLAATA